MPKGVNPEFLKAMREAEQRQVTPTTPTSRGGLIEEFRSVLEAGLGSLDGHSTQVLEACCHGVYSELVEAKKAQEVCSRCPGLEACEFQDGYRPVVTPFVDGAGFYVSRVACKYKAIEMNRVEFERRSSQSGLPPRYRRCRFEEFEAVRGTEAALRASQEYAERFDDDTERGLYLVGGVGSGKTHLAVATVQRVIDRGFKGRFLLVPDWLREIKRSFGGTSDEERSITGAFEFDGLLVVDDIGAERATDWVEEQLYLGVNYRYTHLLPTIFTSNEGPGQLEQRLGKRTVSRIIEMCDAVPVNAPDYRKRGLGGAAS